MKSDLFDWGTLAYTLMMGRGPERETDSRKVWKDVEQIRERDFPVLEERLMGKIVRKCWMRRYGSAEDVRWDLEAFLREGGWEVEGDGIRGFVPGNIEGIEI